MTTEWMMVFLSREPSQKPAKKSAVTTDTSCIFTGVSGAHTGTVGKGVSRVIKA